MASWFYRLRAKILIGSFALLLGFSFLGFNTTQASNAACLQQLGTASMNGTNIVLNFEVSGRYILKIFSEPEAETQVDVILPIDGNSYQPPAEYQPLFGKKGYTFVVQPIGETADSIPCLDDYPYNPIVENLIDDIFEFLNCPASAAASTSTAALALSAGSEVADTSGNTAFVPDPACTRAPECPEGVQAATENSTNRCEIYSNICGVPASGWTLVDRCPMDMAHHFEIQGLTAQVRLGDVVSFTVNATDRHGNLSNDYQGTVRFASGDDGALLPMDHVFVIGDAGSFAAAVTFNTPGVQTLTVQDMNNFNILGTIQVEVIPGLLCAAQVQPAVDPLGDNCTDFANPCLVPAGWTTVNTCGGFPESCGQDINNDSDLLDAGEQCDNGTVDGMCYNNDGCNNCMNADIITCPAGSEVVCGQCVTLSSCGEDADTTDGLPGLLDAGETCDNGQVDGVCYNNDGCNNCEVASVVDCDPGSFFQCGVCVSEGDFVTEEEVTLDFWVSGDKEIYAAGDIVTYTVYIENNNTVALRNVVVGGTLEPGFAFNTLESEGSALAGIEWVDHTLVGAAGLVDVATVNNQDFDFAISDIEPGERRQYKYSVDILIGDAAPAAGSYDNAVSLDADFIEAVVSPSDTIRIIGNAEGSCRLPGYSQLDVATDGTYLYVLIWDDNNDEMVYKFDPSDCSVIDTYVAGGPNGGLFGLAYDGSKFWASGHQSLLYGLDDQFIIDSTKNLRIGGGRGAAFADGLVWVMHDTDRNEITATDITTRAARIKFRMPNFIKPFGFAANDQALWVAADRNIYALSKQDGSILHTIDMPTFDGYITGLTILGDDLWVVD
ncbi:MAG TPA: hypothetical protein VIT68_04375, partial [Candidatus Gracilibacteria bacterium]